MDRHIASLLGGIVAGAVILIIDGEIATNCGLLLIFFVIQEILLIIGHGKV